MNATTFCTPAKNYEIQIDLQSKDQMLVIQHYNSDQYSHTTYEHYDSERKAIAAFRKYERESKSR